MDLKSDTIKSGCILEDVEKCAEKFRENLRKISLARQVTFTEIATACGIAPTTVYRYLMGLRKPDLNSIVQIASVYGVTIEWLLGMDTPIKRTVTPEEDELLNLFYIASPDDKKSIRKILHNYEVLLL